MERLEDDGRTLWRRWTARCVPRALVTQASAVCYTAGGQVLLVAGPNGRWSLPGGHPEPRESLRAAVRREVWEEGCATVLALRYLGAQVIFDPAGPRPCYAQTRWWARVTLAPFEARFETTTRCLVSPLATLTVLGWPASEVARRLFAQAAAVERRHALPSMTHSLLELAVLGRELWAGIDAQQYVDQLRDEWDERP